MGHINVQIEPPCCNGYDSEGNISCGCRGRFQLLCLDDKCPGIETWEVDELMGENI